MTAFALENIDIAGYAQDGRLTGEPEGRHYDWSEMIRKFRQLGRTLTEQESELYRSL